MTAKQDLFDRLKYLGSASELPILIDQGVAKNEHNGVANLLRKGLGIVSFNIMEDYIKQRTAEALKDLSSSRVSFSMLPDFLQEASTLSALNSLAFKVKILKKEGGDWKALIQDEALNIHSTKNPVFNISKYALASSGSNVTASELTDILRAFGIEGGWETLKAVADSIGGGLPDPRQTYLNASERRHNCAHVADYNYDYQWLSAIKNEIITICASLDILLSARHRQAKSDCSKKLKDHDIKKALNYKFIEADKGNYRETKNIGGRAIKVWKNMEDAVNNIQPKLENNNEFLILLNESRRICDWHT